MTLQAGRDFTAGADVVKAGTGNIALGGTGSLQAHNGDVSLLAGNNVTVAAGHIRTVGGGDISVRALAGPRPSRTRPRR